MAGQRVALLQAVPEFAEQLAAAVEESHPATTVDVYTPEQDRLARVRAILTGDYDIVQVDETLANGMVAALRRLRGDTRLVVCFRGWADYTNAHGQYGAAKMASIRARTRAVLKMADGVAYLSDATRERLQAEYDAPEGTIVRRPIAVNRYAQAPQSTTATADAKQPRQQSVAATDGGRYDVLTVTNLRYEQKRRGVETIAEALTPLFETDSALRYRVAGGGGQLPILRETLASHEYRDRIELLGERTDVAALLGDADLFTYVSYLDAHPTAVLEARAAGLPIVAGDAGGVAETVGDAAVVCEPSPKPIRAAVAELREDDSKRRRMGRRAAREMRRYNERAAEDFVNLWERVTAGTERNGPDTGNERVDALASRVTPDETVLDLGCVQHDADAANANDWLHKHLATRAGEVVGVDYLEDEVAALNSRGWQAVCADVQDMDLDRKFDVVVAGELIEHLTNVDGFLESCKRHLADEGRLLLTTPNPWSFHRFRQALTDGEVFCNPDHTCWYDERTLRQLLTDYAFEVESVEYVRPSYRGVTQLLYDIGQREIGATSLLIVATLNGG